VADALRVAIDPEPLTDDERKKITRLLGPAQKGDEKALDALRPIMDRVGMWKYLGDLTRRVEESWLEAMTGRNKLVREAYEKRFADLRQELLEPGESALERLLVDRVIACWIQVAHADMCHAVLLSQDSYGLPQGTYYQDRQDRAHARFLKSVKALATVRRLLVPAVQVNIGKNQIINQGAQPAASEESVP
jgi:hypothetical protein